MFKFNRSDNKRSSHKCVSYHDKPLGSICWPGSALVALPLAPGLEEGCWGWHSSRPGHSCIKGKVERCKNIMIVTSAVHVARAFRLFLKRNRKWHVIYVFATLIDMRYSCTGQEPLHLPYLSSHCSKLRSVFDNEALTHQAPLLVAAQRNALLLPGSSVEGKVKLVWSM